MKKTILLLLILNLISCSKNNDINTSKDDIIGELNFSAEILENFGVKPTNVEEISYVGLLRDSITYKLAGGRRTNKAWISKFKPDGTEIYNLVIPSSIDGIEFSNINNSSILVIDNNLLFIRSYFSKFPNGDTHSLVSIYDFTTGKELGRCPVSSTQELTLKHQNDFYYILFGKYPVTSKNLYLNCINQNGKYLWGRETTELEQTKGFDLYPDFKVLDDSLILFLSNNDHKIKIIDLKIYSPKLEIPFDYVPFIGDKFSEMGISYKFYNAAKIDNIINIYFDENKETEIIDDQITGAHHTVYNLQNRYYYSIKYLTGEIIGKFKL